MLPFLTTSSGNFLNYKDLKIRKLFFFKGEKKKLVFYLCTDFRNPVMESSSLTFAIYRTEIRIYNNSFPSICLLLCSVGRPPGKVKVVGACQLHWPTPT